MRCAGECSLSSPQVTEHAQSTASKLSLLWLTEHENISRLFYDWLYYANKNSNLCSARNKGRKGEPQKKRTKKISCGAAGDIEGCRYTLLTALCRNTNRNLDFSQSRKLSKANTLPLSYSPNHCVDGNGLL